MKQLTVFEMEEISGGYCWDFSSITGALTSIVFNSAEANGASILGATAGALAGSAMGGIFGGNGGGILGIGSIGQAVGMICGLYIGGLGGAVAGVMVGWDITLDKCIEMFDGFVDGTLAYW